MDGRPVDLARARREAKALLRAARAGDGVARARMASVPPGGALRLADAQLAIARELGARSWPALVREEQARDERARTFVEWATCARREDAEALLALDPGLGRQGLDAALVLGDVERVRAVLAGDPGVARRAFGTRDWEPLLYVIHSVFLDGERSDGLVACLELLLEAGARVQGAMALAHAAQRGLLAPARVLLERGPERWGERENALQWAVHPDASADMLRLLVEHGADLEASFDGSGRTPYGVAVRSGRADLAELLAALGARRRSAPLDELLGACQAGDGATARRLAAAHPEAVRLLRSAEAGMLARWAADGHRKAVEILLDLGVPVDARGPGGLTALQEATACNHADLVTLLVQRGADPGKRAPEDGPVPGEPPYGELGWAAERSYLRLLAGSPLAERRPCGDGVAVLTGVDSNTENGVACSRIEDDVDATIAATLRWLAGGDAPAQWLLADPVHPADLRERLVAAGARPERTAVVVGAVLDHLTLDDPPPPGLEIAAVRDTAALGAWAAVVEPAEPRARVIEVLAGLGLGAEAPLQHRLARRKGEVIGAASFLRDGDTVLGRELAVVAPERRAGVGRALVQALAREALATGARVAVAAPTPDSVAFYRLLGFVLRPWPRDRSFYLPTER